MKKNSTQKKQDDAIKLESWMPIKSPCNECENVVFSPPTVMYIGPKQPQPKIRGCELSRDGFGNIIPIAEFRDPHKECSEFSSMIEETNKEMEF